MLAIKNSISLQTMCQNLTNLKFPVTDKNSIWNRGNFIFNLGQFTKEIEKYGFEEEPNYARLVFYLEQCREIHWFNENKEETVSHIKRNVVHTTKRLTRGKSEKK